MSQKWAFIGFKLLEISLATLIFIVLLIPKDLIQPKDVLNMKDDLLIDYKLWRIQAKHVFCTLDQVNSVSKRMEDYLSIRFGKNKPMFKIRACQCNETDQRRQEEHEREKDDACCCIMKVFWIAAGTVFLAIASWIEGAVELAIVLLVVESKVGPLYTCGGIFACLSLFLWVGDVALWWYYTRVNWPFEVYEADLSEIQFYKVTTSYSVTMFLCGFYAILCLLEVICFCLMVIYIHIAEEKAISQSRSAGSVGLGKAPKSVSSKKSLYVNTLY